MQTEVHAHDVLAMMSESTQPFTRESLLAAITSRFGAEARFHTCSAAGMTAPELVEFLELRRKFMPVGAGFALDPARACHH